METNTHAPFSGGPIRGRGPKGRQSQGPAQSWTPRPPKVALDLDPVHVEPARIDTDFDFDEPDNVATQINPKGKGNDDAEKKKRNRTRNKKNVGAQLVQAEVSMKEDLMKEVRMDTDAVQSGASAVVVDTSSESKAVHLSSTRFQDLVQQGVICAPVGRALKEVIGHEFLTMVQDKTIKEIIQGTDCLAQAKTGTGKTLGFLIPAIERLVRSTPSPSQLPHPNSVSILVISPT
ncbi:hypothetical protein HDU99_009474, partial [Rhizoclosmatium hyalinum]